MKIEITLTEKKREHRDTVPGLESEFFPSDLKSVAIYYDVHVGPRKTLEFAIIVPYQAEADGLTEMMLQDIAETRFRQTLEGSIRNEAIARRVAADLDESRRKAIDALSRYKFQMFGYWAAIWVHLNRIEGTAQANPFRGFVRLAKRAISFGE